MRLSYFFVGCILSLSTSNLLLAQQDPVDLIATNTFGVIGNEVTIDIKVNGFTDIIAAQASINWDPGLLTFKNVSNFGITDLDEDDFGTNSADEGHVRFIWTPADAVAVTVDDGTVLFTATFEVISDNEASAIIGFIDNISSPPHPIEFANSAYEILTVNTSEGEIEIFSSAADLVNITSSPNTSCDEKVTNGILKADVRGQTDPYTFNWYIGAEVKANPDFTGSTIDQLPAGEYTLQVLDGNNEVFLDKKNTMVLDIPSGTPDIITEILNASQTSCSTEPEDFTGAIEIEVNDEQPADTYNISWWKGDSETGEELTSFTNQYKADQLEDGDYEIVVENPSTTCKSYFSSTITEDLFTFSVTLSSVDNQNCGETGNGSTTAKVDDASGLNVRYYWFMENDVIDTTQALAKASTFEDLTGGNYKSYVADLNSSCVEESVVSVEDKPVYPVPEINQSNDTLLANYDNSKWFLGENDLNITAQFLVPGVAGWYSISVTNEYYCTETSDLFNFNVTGMKDQISQILIYPNPFNEYVRISNVEGKINNLKIFDYEGQLIDEYNDIKQRFIDLYLTDSPNGIYFIKIQNGEKLITRKVVKNQ